MTQTELISDVMRVWSWGGAALAIGPLSKWNLAFLRRWLDGKSRFVAVPVVAVIFLVTALIGLTLFALAAGLVIPLTTRLQGFGMDSPVFQVVMLFAWTMVATACWMTALGLRKGKPLIATAALLWFLAVVFGLPSTVS